MNATAVESVLRSLPAVADVAVIAHPDAMGTRRVVAYIVSRFGMRYTDSELRASVRAALPRRCVPQRIVELPAIVRDHDGSVVHGALRSPFAASTHACRHVAPGSQTEMLMADAWCEALGVPQVSLTDNFFRIGGTSLLCFRVIESLRRSTGRRLNPRVLLAGTLEQAAAEFDGQPIQARPLQTSEPAGVLARLKGIISGI